MFRQSLLFMLEFCQELLVNSCNCPDFFAWLPACCNGLFLTLEEVILEYQRPFLGPFSIQGLIPQESAGTVSLQSQSLLSWCPGSWSCFLPYLLFSGFWTPPCRDHCSQDWFQRSHLHPSSFVIMRSSRTCVPTQSSISASGNTVQEPPAYLHLCCSFGRYQVGEVSPGEPQPATWDVFCLQKTFSICSSWLWHL